MPCMAKREFKSGHWPKKLLSDLSFSASLGWVKWKKREGEREGMRERVKRHPGRFLSPSVQE